MPYSAEHRERTRARIVDAARRVFNRQGFDTATIDGIMAEAGLTRGGFYNHFRCKDDLYAEAVASFANCNPFAITRREQPGLTDPGALARLLVDLYLSDAVMADPDMHCPLYALPSDVARAGLRPREAYTQIIQRMRMVFAAACGDGEAAETRASALVSLCVGGMLLARTTADEALRHQLRDAARRQAHELLAAR